MSDTKESIVEVDVEGQLNTAARRLSQTRSDPGAWLSVDWLAAIGLSVLGVLVPLLVSVAAGSFGIARSDDWAWQRVAVHFFHTGQWNFLGWAGMTLAGQVLWAQPFLLIFGTHGWVFDLSTVVLAVVGLFCAYYLARLVLPRRLAAGAVLLVVIIPSFAINTSTFMTDIPAFAAAMVCLAVGATAMTRHGQQRWTRLIIAMVVGVFGFAIREFAIAAPLAVLLCAEGSDKRHRRRYLMMGVVELAICALIYQWAAHVPGSAFKQVQTPTIFTLEATGRAYFTFAFFVCPAVALAAARRLRALSTWALASGILTCLIGGRIFLLQPHGLFVSNNLLQSGAADGFLLAGTRPILLPGPIWTSLSLLALASGGALACFIVEAAIHALPNWRSWLSEKPTSLIWAFGILMALALTAQSTTQGLLDRYLYPLVLPVAIWLLNEARQTRNDARDRLAGSSVAVISGVIVAGTAVALLLNSDFYDGARWRSGEVAVAHGIAPKWIDAGYEWVGAHSEGIVDTKYRFTAPGYETWYARFEPGFRECGLASGSQAHIPGLVLRLVKTEHYRLLGFVGPEEPIYVYVSPFPDCRTSGHVRLKHHRRVPS